MQHGVVSSFRPLPARARRQRRWPRRLLLLLLLGASTLLLALQRHTQLRLVAEEPWAASLPVTSSRRGSDLLLVPPAAELSPAAPLTVPANGGEWATPRLASLRQQMLAEAAEAGSNFTPLGLPTVPPLLHQTWKDAPASRTRAVPSTASARRGHATAWERDGVEGRASCSTPKMACEARCCRRKALAHKTSQGTAPRTPPGTARA